MIKNLPPPFESLEFKPASFYSNIELLINKLDSLKYNAPPFSPALFPINEQFSIISGSYSVCISCLTYIAPPYRHVLLIKLLLVNENLELEILSCP